ncbi:MAG: hypothetical protein IH631_07770, partial [Candidatus Thorarchaeota archaeon]|nr:hypothetical protein [Candidatus Thorarchaeota archaeon]
MKAPPKTNHKKIKQIFSQAESDLKLALKGAQIPKGEGLFGESREFIVFELAKTSSQAVDSLPIAKKANDQLMLIFRDAKEEVSSDEMIEAMTLCLHGLVLGNYDEEDFRYLYRYSLRYIRGQTQLEKWLRKALLYLVAANNESATDILSEIRFWIQFLGAPFFGPALFAEAGSELGIDLQKELDAEHFRLVDAVARHPQYLKEAVQDMTFFDTYEGLKEWGPDALQSQLLKIKRKDAYEKAQEKINSRMSVRESVKVMQQVFEKEKFRTNEETVLPARLQELATPPPGEAIDPG